VSRSDAKRFADILEVIEAIRIRLQTGRSE